MRDIDRARRRPGDVIGLRPGLAHVALRRSSHSGVSRGATAEKLHLRWTRLYAPRVQTWDNPLNNDKMTFDKTFEPIVVDGKVFVGFNDSDQIVALDANTGEELWAFFTDGPVRLPPAAWREKIYLASDDGCLYCIRASDGERQWKYRGGPSAQKVLGNKRLISMWPARGGPAVRDGRVYFAAGIWPFVGVFVYALDAETGQLAWINDHTGPNYSLQPHGSAAFGSVAPQGPLVAADDLLLAPGGRSLPAAFDRSTGTLVYFHNAGLVGGKSTGGSFVAAGGNRCFVHAQRRGVRAFDLKTGQRTKLDLPGEPVITDSQLYVARDGTSDGADPVIEAVGSVSWKIEADGTGDMIKAGNRLYAAGKDSIVAVQLPGKEGKPSIAWSTPVKGRVARLLAGDNKLFAVTLEGRIMAFGAEKTGEAIVSSKIHPLQPSAVASRTAQELLRCGVASEGYALCYGVDDGRFLDALLALSKLHVVAVDPDASRIDSLRRHYDRAGLYGHRIALHQGDPLTFKAPSYIAGLVVVGQSLASQYAAGEYLEQVYRSVRPYGGAAWFPLNESRQAELKQRLLDADLPNAQAVATAGGLMLVRQGPLDGAADWTHQYGDVANTGKSNDRRVRLPLGILWFGGNSNEDTRLSPVAPPEQVVGGRLFLPGIDGLSARDVYTGRVLWRNRFGDEDLVRFGIPPSRVVEPPPTVVPDDVYQLGKPADVYQSNTRGTNFVATKDRIYFATGNVCRVLDPTDGKLVNAFQLPRLGSQDKAPDWGYIGVYEGVLLAGWGFAEFSKTLKREGAGPTTLDKSASAGLVAFDRHSGEVLWRTRAKYSFIHNGIVAGGRRVYCLDRWPAGVEQQLRRRHKTAGADYRIAAFDYRTGKLLWKNASGIFGTWLSYSEKHDVLLQAIDHGPARINRRQPGRGMTAHAGKDGSLRWKKDDIDYFGPCLLLDETILTNGRFYGSSAGAFNLLDGSPVTISNPLTGIRQPWHIARGYGCNSMRAGEHLLTYRSGSAAYYDLDTKSGTGSLGGFRSGCTSNLVIADGVLNAPDRTRHCLCTFQNQTSLALIHMPDVAMETWTTRYGPLNRNDFLAFTPVPVKEMVKRVGINLGAPGDRQAAGGTLWLDYPEIGGASYSIPVVLKGDRIESYRRHEASVAGPLRWVAASCVAGVRRVSIDLNTRREAESGKTPKYTVRLVFAELAYARPGQRVFDVSLQGKRVLKRLDVVTAAGGINRTLVQEFRAVAVPRTLDIALTPAPGSLEPILCGVEVVVMSK